MKIKNNFFILSFLFLNAVYGQETLPIYSDYLTDNMYLVHPAAAGVSDYAKLRITARKQWFGIANAPELQTVSFHSQVGNQLAMGVAIFNDKNGHFSQGGGQLTLAYHLNLKNESHRVTFGLSAIALKNTLDGSDYRRQDSDVSSEILNSNYFNTDAGISYVNKSFFSFYTVKNILNTPRVFYDEKTESSNLRKHLLTLGYYFNKDDKYAFMKIQPSIMIQYEELMQNIYLDSNIKLFFPFYDGEFWAGSSYRRSLDEKSLVPTNQFASFFGINYKNYILSYTYTNQISNYILSNDHQISLGYNFNIGRSHRKIGTYTDW